MKYLVEILDKEVDAYSGYLVLATKKKQALISNDIDTLESINVQEKGLSAKILALEAARTEFLREQGFNTNIILDDLLGVLPDVDKERVQKSANKLREILVNCRKFNEDNMALLRQSSSYINHMIRIFSKSINKEQVTYNNKGTQKFESGEIADLQG